MNEPTISFVGNLTADPELKFTPTGKAVTNLGVACNPRRYDAQNGSWVDGTPIYWQCEVWGTLGENAAESLRKGDRVVVTGQVKAYVWTPTEGEHAGVEQRRVQIVVDELGPSLRFATAKVVKGDRTTAGSAGAGEPPF